MIRYATAAMMVLAPLALAGQRNTPVRNPLPAPVLERTIGDDSKVILYNPSMMVSLSDRSVAVFDESEMQVVALSTETGRKLWSFGRKGAGPREFSGGHQLLRDRDGNIVVLDKSNGRLTVLSQTGQIIS